MEKRTEQFNAKITVEMKRQVLEFCHTHGINESELSNTALLTYLELFNSIGPVRLMALIQGALHS